MMKRKQFAVKKHLKMAHFGHSWQIKRCFLHYSKQSYANSLQWFGSKSKHNEESTNPPSGSSGGSVESCPSYMSLFSLSLSLTCLHPPIYIQYRNIHLYCKWVCVCVWACVCIFLIIFFLLIFYLFLSFSIFGPILVILRCILHIHILYVCTSSQMHMNF